MLSNTLKKVWLISKCMNYTIGNTGVTDYERNGFNVSDFTIKATVYPNGTAMIDTRMTND